MNNHFQRLRFFIFSIFVPLFFISFNNEIQLVKGASIAYPDFYKTLGIEKSATDREIKRAYRKIDRQYVCEQCLYIYIYIYITILIPFNNCFSNS